MINNLKNKGKRPPINKPEKFIEYLDLLNVLPDNLDDFLKRFAKKRTIWVNQQEQLKIIRLENQSRNQKGQPPIELSPEARQELLYPYLSELKQMYAEFLENLPEKLKNYIEDHCADAFVAGERFLNMMAVERESIEIVIQQRNLWHNFQRDFQEWKSIIEKSDDQAFRMSPYMAEMYGLSQKENNLTDEQLYKEFCNLMKHKPTVQQKFNAEKYRVTVPGVEGSIYLLPNINEKLHYHRGNAGSARTGFTGFFTRLAADSDFLDIEASGLIGIILETKKLGAPRIELDRLKHCEFCNNLLYAYKGNQIFCSSKCYTANYKQQQRNDNLTLLKKELKKANKRLKNLQSRLDGDSGLITDQLSKVQEIQSQIEQETINGTV